MQSLRRVAERVRQNLPSRKPQIWINMPLVLQRRLTYKLGTFLDPAWPDKPRVARMGEGDIVMELVPGNLIDRAIYLHGTYELAATRLVQTVLRKGMTFVDVGANIGYFTLMAGGLVGNTGRVFAFEPAPRTAQRLRRNIELNALRNVQVIEKIVTRASGSTLFYDSTTRGDTGCPSILPGTGRATVGVPLAATSLDDFLEAQGNPRVDLLKIDVEGAEEEVFAGAERLLARDDAPVILFESFDPGSRVPTLARFGYTTRVLHYSPARQELEFPVVGVPFDNLFAAYEGPNHVALKERSERNFESIARTSKRTR